ncbi:MAG: M42 family metallopeptidase [Clostridiaceae bacterium]|nr:M42 family metallopeptidase [Clostridiaceae bacterium]
MRTDTLLEQLCKINAIAGFEASASNEIKEIFGRYCDKVWVDTFYNVIGYKKGSSKNGKKIMITAHYDQIGLIVTGYEKNGFLRVSNLGGVDTKALLAREVTVHGKKDVFGVIGAKPPHLLSGDEMKKNVKLTDLFIDTGLPDEELKETVAVGDPVSINSQFVRMVNGCAAGRNLDNRCGVAACVLALEKLKNIEHENDVYVIATVQEEAGLIGAISSSYNIEPDIAVVIDVCHGDMPEADKASTFTLGKGVPVGVGPAFNKNVTQQLLKLADQEGIPTQLCVEAGDPGTEAWAIQVSGMGIAVVEVCIPLRYMHTGAELVNLEDVDTAAALVSKFAAGRTVRLSKEDADDTDTD